jgi:hypothetical protein
MRMVGQPDPSKVRLARIKNTLQATQVQFSPSLLDQTEKARVEVTGPARPMNFDSTGRLL